MDLTTILFVQARKYTPGRTSPVQLIVLHDEESPEAKGSARNVAHFFATTAEASAHFTVDDQGPIQCVKLEDTAWQCVNANHNGCGIEHSGFARFTPDDWANEYSTAMLEQSAQLTAALCAKFGIPAVKAEFADPDVANGDPTVTQPGITCHMWVPKHGSHSDPGPNFPFDAYVARVDAILNPPADGGN